MIPHLNTLNINKNTTFGIGNPGPRLCDQSRKNEAVFPEGSLEKNIAIFVTIMTIFDELHANPI